MRPLPDADVPDALGLALPVVRVQDGLLRVVVGGGDDTTPSASAWLDAVVARHTAGFTRPEFLKAVRALSARYVESRASLPSRSPVDSAGKRAAFAGFYAPLHFLTASALIRLLSPAAACTRVVDLGCGTGVAGLACATSLPARPALIGVDLNAWALAEMRWNCDQFGLECRTQRVSMVEVLDREVAGARRRAMDGTTIVCAWSINELSVPERERILAALLDAHRRGASVLVIEPLARSAAPWWPTWAGAISGAGGQDDEWRFDPGLPALLAGLDEDAGFRRDHLTARSFWLPRM